MLSFCRRRPQLQGTAVTSLGGFQCTSTVNGVEVECCPETGVCTRGTCTAFKMDGRRPNCYGDRCPSYCEWQVPNCPDTNETCYGRVACVDGSKSCPGNGSICVQQGSKGYTICNDPCAGVLCERGGTCKSGLCKCPPGLGGPTCTSEEWSWTFDIDTKWPNWEVYWYTQDGVRYATLTVHTQGITMTGMQQPAYDILDITGGYRMATMTELRVAMYPPHRELHLFSNGRKFFIFNPRSPYGKTDMLLRDPWVYKRTLKSDAEMQHSPMPHQTFRPAGQEIFGSEKKWVWTFPHWKTLMREFQLQLLDINNDIMFGMTMASHGTHITTESFKNRQHVVNSFGQPPVKNDGPNIMWLEVKENGFEVYVNGTKHFTVPHHPQMPWRNFQERFKEALVSGVSWRRDAPALRQE